MRRWNLGYPLSSQPAVGSRPCQYWMNLYVLSHQPEPAGWRRLEWPDGKPLLTQSWRLVTIFQVIGDELAQIAQERQKRKSGRLA